VIVAYFVGFFVVALAFAYQFRFTEATLHLGRLLAGTTEGTGVQDAITPPNSNYLAYSTWLAVLVVLGLGFYLFGFLRGLGAVLGFLVLAMLIRVVLPRGDSGYFGRKLGGSMVKRYVKYMMEGDKVRAGAMAELLRRGAELSGDEEYVEYTEEMITRTEKAAAER